MSSPHSPQSADGENKFGANSPPCSTTVKLNNNEPMFNSNLCPNQSPKEMRNTATSPVCRAPSRNGNVSLAPLAPRRGAALTGRFILIPGQSSPSQLHSPKNNASPTNGNKSENQRFKAAGGNVIQRCNNCARHNQNERPGLLQTPASPAKVGQPFQHSPKTTNLPQNAQNAQNAQNNQKSEQQRRPNTLNICNNQCSAQCGNTLSVSRPGSRHKLRHQNSSQGSFDSASPCLSRGSFIRPPSFCILYPYAEQRFSAETNLFLRR